MPFSADWRHWLNHITGILITHVRIIRVVVMRHLWCFLELLTDAWIGIGPTGQVSYLATFVSWVWQVWDDNSSHGRWVWQVWDDNSSHGRWVRQIWDDNAMRKFRQHLFQKRQVTCVLTKMRQLNRQLHVREVAWVSTSVCALILTTFPMSDYHEIAMVDASWKK